MFLSVGGNVGDRLQYMKSVYYEINSNAGIIEKASPLYLSEPWGFLHNRYFLNSVFQVSTCLELEMVFSELLNIENRLGRQRKASSGYLGRTIDIDVISFDDVVISNKMITVPHPRMCDRLFVLLPMYDIAPNWVHPLTGESLKTLIQKCSDTGKIRRTKMNYYE